MAKKTKQKINVNDEKKNKMSKMAFYTLLFLVAEIAICLVISIISGDTELSKIQDNFLTGLLQNYNYILGAVCLIPAIVIAYQKIKAKLNERFISDSQLVTYGFLGVLVTIIAIISVCSIIYPINSSTYYGINSVISVGLFICPVIVLLLEMIVYGALIIPSLIREKTFWKTVKKNAPMVLMVMFLIWTFISCMLAPSAVDDVLGNKAIDVVLGSNSKNTLEAAKGDVLSKTLNGCYNLKDGFWAFLMYGSVLLVAMYIGKDKIKEKKILIKVFVGVICVLCVLMLPMIFRGGPIFEKYHQEGERYINEKEITSQTWEIHEQYNYGAQKEIQEAYSLPFVYYQRGIFRNSNHFAYVLCMSIIAAAVLMITEKSLYEKILYLLAFSIMTYVLIINNTFGGYLGVLVALICLFIFGVMHLIRNIMRKEKTNGTWINIVGMVLLVVVFLTLSLTVRDGYYGNIIAKDNLERFGRDIQNFGGFMLSEENATEVDVATLDNTIAKAGSGRGETWLKVWELIKQRPMFGYGLECLLFQFSGQFGVNEGRTHNLLLQLLATVGIPGTIMYFTALAIIFIRLLKNWKTWDDIEKICTFVGISYMVTALTGNSTYYTSPYFMMFLGFVVLVPWKRQEKMEEKTN